MLLSFSSNTKKHKSPFAEGAKARIRKRTILILKSYKRFYNYFLSKDKALTRRLVPIIGFVPANINLFKLAFSHRSNDQEGKLPSALRNNERLEYLGDAILGTIVAEYLFKKYPHAQEGFLTKMRSKIVKRTTLNEIGEKMGLDLLLSEYNQTRLSRSMLGNAVEALVGAVYLEKGYAATRHYVIKHILKRFLDIHSLEKYDDNYKSQLLEWCQKNGKSVEFKLLAKYKLHKRDRFKIAVLINGEKKAVADDFNKKSAEQLAAEKTLKKLGITAHKPEKN